MRLNSDGTLTRCLISRPELRDTVRHLGMASKPKNGHTGGPNPPDYVCPKRRGRRPFTIYLPIQVKAAMLETARRNGTTMQDAGEQLCEAYVETGGKLLDLSKT